jgi:hypothetical protein
MSYYSQPNLQTIEFVSKETPVPLQARMRSGKFATVAMVVSIALTGFVLGWYQALQTEAGDLSIEEQRLEAEWVTASARLQEARSVMPRYEAYMEKARRAQEDLSSQRLTPALRSIALSMGADVELQKLSVVKLIDRPGAHRFDIQGVSTGADARATAGRFLLALEAELERQFQVSDKGRFERLDDEVDPQGEIKNQHRATFSITATINLNAKPKTGDGQ